MTSRPGYLLIDLQASDGSQGHVLAPIVRGMTDAASIAVYTMTTEQRPTSVVKQIIAYHVDVGALEDRDWQISSWRRISDQDRRLRYPDLPVPPFPRHRRPGQERPQR
jgi:hypothetical protein